jgi:hypothetical protein
MGVHPPKINKRKRELPEYGKCYELEGVYREREEGRGARGERRGA